jgi:hypothetical protein
MASSTSTGFVAFIAAVALQDPADALLDPPVHHPRTSEQLLALVDGPQVRPQRFVDSSERLIVKIAES